MYELLFLLIAGHAIGDFALQNDFIAKGKNHLTPVYGVPWIIILLAHAWIHAGIVLYITNNLFIATCELLAHTFIDFMKTENVFGLYLIIHDEEKILKYSFALDQILHILCKILWWYLLI